MALRITLILLAVAMCHADARRASRRGDDDLIPPGGFRRIDSTKVPQEVKSYVEETLISSFNSNQGVRLVEILKVESQQVSGQNYKMVILFQVTECPASASREDINDDSVCAYRNSITCDVLVYHQPWTNTISLTEVQCSQ